eukprot:TRINITY_DN3951_c0_g3_i1.p1 TRINITY_DN3951_c0_g3~~TRINITY_DN3951_c0_g3_i1.p1  ORF type:complete len:507 (+),score=190.98 TRINITY_DN3951_c0_g3_i1:109-1521(+)
MADQPLLPSGDAEGRKVLLNFCLMTTFFALNHGTVTAVIPLASPEFGNDLGVLSLGVLYGFYTLSALFASTYVVEHLGQKWSLMGGCATYTLYVLGNLLGVLTHGWLRWFVVIVGGAFGGMAAGFLWTAQGGYFAGAAKAYAAAKQMEEKDATAFMSALFAAVYLALEVIIKIMSSVVVYGVCHADWKGSFLTGECPETAEHQKWRGIVITYIVFTCIAVASTVGMSFIKSFDPPAKKPGAEGASLMRKAMAAIEIMIKRPEIMLLGMFNVQFGVTSAYLNSYVTGTIIGGPGSALGKDKVGYFTAIIPLVAAGFAFPLAWITDAMKGDKTVGMVIGMSAWLGFGLVFLLTDVLHWGEEDALVSRLDSWGALVPLFVVFGIGRSCWESINKAVFADMFKDDTEAAFAMLIVQLGLTSTATFICYRYLTNLPKEIIMCCCGVMAFVGYFGARHIHAGRAKHAAADTQDNEF